MIVIIEDGTTLVVFDCENVATRSHPAYLEVERVTLINSRGKGRQ